MRTFMVGVSALVIGSAAVALAEEGHLDVMPVAVIGDPSRIETGAFDFDGFAVDSLPPVRVYENDLDDLGIGLLVGEAGFTSPSAFVAATQLGGSGYTNLAGGVDVRFDFRSFSVQGGPAVNLWYWDGVDDDNDLDFSDDVDFQPAGATLTFEKLGGAFSVSVDGSSAGVAGFVVDTTIFDDPGTSEDETGFMHLDLDALLDGDAGIYAILLDVTAGADAAPIFWLFNAGLGEEGEAAVEAAADVVPEPATGAALAIAVLALLRGVRRGARG